MGGRESLGLMWFWVEANRDSSVVGIPVRCTLRIDD